MVRDTECWLSEGEAVKYLGTNNFNACLVTPLLSHGEVKKMSSLL